MRPEYVPPTPIEKKEPLEEVVKGISELGLNNTIVDKLRHFGIEDVHTLSEYYEEERLEEIPGIGKTARDSIGKLFSSE